VQETLQDLGLSKNETKIYLFLLRYGSTTTGSIIKETNIVNSQVYETLNKLIAKGLVTFNTQKDGKHFQAASPDKFKEIETERLKKVEKLIPGLEEIKNTSKEKTRF
jgi:sugar-specific transcriptional regulator TrmB